MAAKRNLLLLPEERNWLDSLITFPLYDTFRSLNPNKNLYSWFDYRSRGFDQDQRRPKN